MKWQCVCYFWLYSFIINTDRIFDNDKIGKEKETGRDRAQKG